MPRLHLWLPALLVAPVLLADAGRCAAQVYVAAPPAVSYYAPPAVSYYAPPAVAYYAPAATVTTYRYGALPRRRVTVTDYYGAAPLVAPAPAVVYPRRAYYYAPVYVRP